MKIAVVGGGIAGLACAWMLSRRYAVTLFERHAQPGFVASSVAVPLSEGSPAGTTSVRVDVPLRVFYPGYYPTLMRLYAALGVATEPVSYATTFMGAAGQPYFRWRNLRLGGFSMPYVLPRDVAGPRARRIVQGALRFNHQSRAALARGELAGRSLRDFLAAGAFPADYVQGLLLPALATIATCTTEDALDYPADVVAGYMAAGLARQSVRRAVLGADGFGLAMDGGRWLKVPQLGGVRIGDDCEIGANTTIDRGALGDTVLEEDVRLDNQIQIGHNCHIGAHTAMAGCVGVAGSTRIGRHCLVAGAAGISGHLVICDKVTISAMTMVTRSITEPGEYSSGLPMQDNRTWKRNIARFRHLDEIVRKLLPRVRELDNDD